MPAYVHPNVVLGTALTGPQERTSGRFENLDAVRTIACVLVLVSHVLFEFITRNFPQSYLANDRLCVFFLGNGGLGVQIFFVLSGFLITHLLLTEQRLHGSVCLRDFYMRRVLRIWPVYFAVLFFVFVVYQVVKSALGFTSPIHESWLKSVLFLSNFDLIRILQDPNLYPNGMLSLTWSVSVEEQFYLFWPLILMSTPPRHLRLTLALLMAASVAFSVLLGEPEAVYHHTVSNVIFLGAGAMLACMRSSNSPVLTRLRSMSPSSWLLVTIAGLAALVWLKAPLLERPGGQAAYMALTALLVFLLLVHQVTVMPINAGLARIPLLVPMAKYTYGMYMYHRIAGFVCSTVSSKLLKIPETMASGAMLVVVTLLLTFGMAWASYRWMESPLLAKKRKYEHAHA